MKVWVYKGRSDWGPTIYLTQQEVIDQMRSVGELEIPKDGDFMEIPGGFVDDNGYEWSIGHDHISQDDGGEAWRVEVPNE